MPCNKPLPWTAFSCRRALSLGAPNMADSFTRLLPRQVLCWKLLTREVRRMIDMTMTYHLPIVVRRWRGEDERSGQGCH